MTEQPDKNRSTLDKIVMGAIIGTAIGSAIGAASAPKSGKETREIVKDRAIKVSKEAKEVSKLAQETGSGVWKLAKILLGVGKKKVMPPAENLRKIPHETDVIPEKRVD